MYICRIFDMLPPLSYMEKTLPEESDMSSPTFMDSEYQRKCDTAPHVDLECKGQSCQVLSASDSHWKLKTLVTLPDAQHLPQHRLSS